ncbi:hypothetical protein BJF87_24070 [Gordonia sp. CNJ-863]|nr:hypothetical protein BJF87_24070 [Gordonia sp. CNJ-863]
MHTIGAIFVAFFGLPPEWVSIIAAACSGALLVAIVVTVRPLVGERFAYIAVLPLVFSPYFLQAALWFNTDSVAVLLALLALLVLNKDQEPLSLYRPVIAGLLALAAVLVRQSSVWVLPVLVVIVVLSGRGQSCRTLLLRVFLALFPAVIGLSIFVALWGGLTAPLANEFNNSGRSIAAVPYAIIIFGLIFTPLLVALPPRDGGPLERKVQIASALVGLGLGAAWMSVPSAESGRHGGMLWTVVGQGLDFADRSVVFVLFVGLASVGLVNVLSRLTLIDSLAVATGLVSVGVVVAAGSQVFQRYVELPALALLAFVLVGLKMRNTLARIWPIYLLVACQATLVSAIVVLPTMGSVS